VADGRQVVCITHLPQIAAFADRHHRVSKRVTGGRTTSEVTALEQPGERQQEVARMMAGATVTAAALEHAAALIEAARAPPQRGRHRVPGRAAARTLARPAEGPAQAGGNR
jgi:DNA repair protein RecN (Recombination protein N)